MKTLSWKKTIGLFILFTLLSLLLYATVSVLSGALNVLRVSVMNMLPPPERQAAAEDPLLQYWTDRLTEMSRPLSRTVTLAVQPLTVTVDVDLWIPDTHPLAVDVAAGAINDPAFVEAAFGTIWISSTEALNVQDQLGPLMWQRDVDRRLVHIYGRTLLNGATTVRGNLSHGVPVIGQDDVIFQLADMGVIALNPMPTVANGNVLTITQPGSVSFWLNAASRSAVTSAPATASGSAAVETRSGQSFLARLGNVDIPFLGRLLVGLLEVLPLMWFWWVVKRDSRQKPLFAISLAGTLTGLLVFHFWLYYLGGSSDLISGLVRSVPGLQQVSELSSGLVRLDPDAPYVVLPVILGIVAPALMLKQAGVSFSDRQRRGWKIIERAALVLVFVGLVASTIYLVARASYADEEVLISVGLAAAMSLVIWLTLCALYRIVDRHAWAVGLNALAALLMVLLAALMTLFGLPMLRSDGWLLWLSVTIGFGVILIWTFVRIVGTQLGRTTLRLTLPRWLGRLIILLLLLAAIPLTSVMQPARPVSNLLDPVNLANALDNLIPLLWLAGVVWLLYDAGKGGQRIEAFTRAVGVLAASLIFFSPLIRWLYLPLTFLLGWFALTRLVHPARYWLKLAPFLQRVYAERVQLLDQILDLNAAESAYKTYRKKQQDKLGEGTVTFVDYDKALDQARQDLDLLREKGTVEGRAVKEVALTFGPYRSAWDNAKHGAQWGLIFALPWLVLYLRDFLNNPVSGSPFLLLIIARSWLLLLLQWAGLGFFFGYFYPYLRGANGLMKGLGLFLALTLPTLPIMLLLGATPEQWQARLFWMLQVFVQCMLLGLFAFDYATLRQGRYNWQMVFEVHGLTTIGVSLSSIVVAVGAAVTTFATTQATSLVTNVLTFIVPSK